MKYTTVYDAITGINVISANGTIESIKLLELVKQAYREIDIDKSKSILFDCRHLIIDNSLTELIIYFDDIENKPRQDLSIVFLHKNQKDIYRFIENSGVNRGWSIRSFEDLDDGINWLKNQ